MYTQKGKSLHQLPPTSESINGHLLRSHYMVQLCTNLIDYRQFLLNPRDYGWKQEGSVLFPGKCLKLMPDEYYTTCSCVACARNCGCRFKDVQCTEYCRCGDRCNNEN